MSECVALITDLIFSTRVRATAEQVGGTCRMVRSADALSTALAERAPRVVLVDMNADGVDTDAAIATARRDAPDATVVAFLSHVQRELAERAAAAGAHEVVPRSVFVQRLPEWLAPSSA